jgi:hypothetical protein
MTSINPIRIALPPILATNEKKLELPQRSKGRKEKDFSFCFLSAFS